MIHSFTWFIHCGFLFMKIFGFEIAEFLTSKFIQKFSSTNIRWSWSRFSRLRLWFLTSISMSPMSTTFLISWTWRLLPIISGSSILYETIMVQMLRKLRIQRKYDIIYTWFVWPICFIRLCWMERWCSMVPCGIAHIWLGWRLNGTGNRFAQHWIVKRH